MPLAKDVKDDIRSAQKVRLPWWLLLCMGIASVPIYWLFDHFGRSGLALPTLNSILVIGFIIAVKRGLRRHAWFWITMTVIAALHVPLILFVPWGTRWVPALVIAGIDSVDFCLMLWIISIIGNFMDGPKPSNDGGSSSSDTTSAVQ